MKRITALLQKLFLSALMSAGFFYALTNINVTCSGPSYQKLLMLLNSTK